MKIKFLALLLVFMNFLIFNMNITFAVDQKEIEAANEVGLLKVLKIFDDTMDGAVKNNKVISRAEFVRYIVKMMKLDGHQQKKEDQFWDVSEDNMDYDSIMTAKSMGLISGYSDNSFKPYGEISYAETLKVLNEILGYGVYADIHGGYPLGYYTVAKENGLLKGMEIKYDEPVRYRYLSKLLFNALNMPLLTQTQYGVTNKYSSNADKSILSEKYEIYKADDIITANDVSGLDYQTQTANNSISIESMILKDENALAREYLGYNVRCYYYKPDSSDTGEVVYVYPHDNDVLLIDAEDIVGADTKGLHYVVNANKQNTVEFLHETDFLYNGKAINYQTDFSSSLFNIEEGMVKCIDNDNDGNYEVICVTEFKNIVVKYKDKEKFAVYDKYDNTNNIVLDPNDNKIKFTMTDTAGNQFSFSDLKENDTLLVTESKDGLLLKIVVGFESVEGIITEVEKDENGIVKSIGVNDQKYDVGSEIANNDDIVFQINERGVFYLNANGRIVGFDYASEFGGKFGLLLDAQKDKGLSGYISVKLLSKLGENSKVYRVSKKVEVDGYHNIEQDPLCNLLKYCDQIGSDPGNKRLSMDDIHRKIESIKDDNKKLSVIRFWADDNNIINKIDTPIRTDREDENTMTKRNNITDSELLFKKGVSLLGGRFYGNEKTLYFGIDVNNITNNEDDIIMYSSLDNEKRYKVNVYSKTEEALDFDVAVVDKSQVSVGVVQETANISIVENISMVLDKDGEEVYSLNYYTGDVYNAYKKYTAVVKKENKHLIDGLHTGDIIRLNIEPKGYVDAIDKLYDYKNEQNVVKDPDTGEFKNPTSSYQECKRYRALYGKVYKNQDGIIRVGTNLNEISENNLEVFKLKGAVQYKVSRNNKVVVSPITSGEIIDYKNGGIENADQVLIQTNYGEPRCIIFIRR